jgi:hypothetical protein
MGTPTAPPTGYTPCTTTFAQPSYNNTTGAQLVDINGVAITIPATVTLQGTVTTQGTASTTPATSIKGTAVLTPAGSSKAVSGAGGLGLTIVSSVAKIIVWASAAGAYLAYNGAASNASIPIPITPMSLDCNATDLALLQMIGNSTITVNVIQQG